MANENIRLDELQELRETYNLMNERLDTQEIITPEQIRETIREKVELLETEVKSALIWGYLLGFPILTLIIHFDRGLSPTALWIAGIFGFATILLNALILHKVSRKDFIELDLQTLMFRERRYRRLYLISIASFFLFWTVYAYVFISIGCGIIYTLTLVTLDIPRFYKAFVRAYREGLQGTIDATPNPLSIIARITAIVLMSICIIFLAGASVLYIIAVFKTYNDESFNTYFILTPLSLLSALIAFIPFVINLIKNRLSQGIPTISIIGFTIAAVMLTAMTVISNIQQGNNNYFSPLIMLVVAVGILFQAYKRRRK